MIRATLLILTAFASIGLAYTFGLWVLFAVFAAVLTTVLFSSAKAPAYADVDDDASVNVGQASLKPARHSSSPVNL